MTAAGQTAAIDAVKAAYSKLSNVEVVAEAKWDVATLDGLVTERLNSSL